MGYRLIFHVCAVWFVIVLVMGVPGHALAFGPSSETLARGAYLFAAGGCQNCHTDTKNKGPLLGGGAAIETPFGIFYAPNISPDKKFGIGRWSDADFKKAMREGVSPSGQHYYPAFPYTAYTLIRDGDLADLKAYIFSLKPVSKPSQTHVLRFPFNIRAGMWFWKLLYFKKGPYVSAPYAPPAHVPASQKSDVASAEWNRGAYLANALFHCGECHTPRTMLGGLDRARSMAGAVIGPGGKSVPNITPALKTGIGRWSLSEMMDLLSEGGLPDGDFVEGKMSEVVEHGTSRLIERDQKAIAIYFKSLKSIENDTSKE
ncbi:MAG: c-type cytochrome [Alphaproteobacteria bacterium]|jgi:mono/diheme cytochrome c family protein